MPVTDMASLISLAFILIPLALTIYWLNYFYKKSRDISLRLDRLSQNEGETSERLSPEQDQKQPSSP